MSGLSQLNQGSLHTRNTGGAREKDIWTVGTLRYTKRALIVTILWLLGNEMCLMLMEHVAPQLTPLILKGNGASNQQIALFMTTLVGIMTIWINPFVSTWSDQHRGPMGRRRPFLLATTPIVALALTAIPLGPRIVKIPWIAAWVGEHSTSVVVMLIGLCYLVYAIFNSVILALFSYYFWDVIPESMLARFQALTKIVSTLANFIWNYFLLGLADRHMEELFLVIAVIFFVVYTLSVWMVKEGEYPPPAVQAKKGIIHSTLSYFKVCFGDSYYLWIFAATTVYQLGNLTNLYRIFYFRDQLHLSLDTIGKMTAWPTLVIVVLAYPVASIIDRLNPVRLVTPALLFWASTNIGAFFFLREKWSLLVWMGLIALGGFFYGTVYSILNVKVFPREKIGQFCSAIQLTNAIACMGFAVPVGMLLDRIKDYSYIFLWSAGLQIGAACLFWKVYLNLKKRLAESEATASSPVPKIPEAECDSV